MGHLLSEAGDVLSATDQTKHAPVGTGEKCLGSIEEQSSLVLSNIRGILRAAGSDLNRVLKMTVYVSDISHWARVNEIYTLFLGEHRPARAVVPVKDLHYGFQIEIEAIAALGEDQQSQ
jgi:2-iminobutanoate/2-iminopropanoate deaminase